ncbi:MotA/TolQ/ExbB proton channel family protein [bacterium]|nr:MotA/TolQ/ExbB proton channel family protein [bacterium]
MEAAPKSPLPENWLTLIFSKSGFFLYPILLCSIVGLAIALMKAMALRSGKILPAPLGKQFLDMARQRDMQGIVDLCGRFNHMPIARVTYSGIELTSAGADVMEKEMIITAGFELQERSRYLPALGVLSNVATLLGLLGTVTGMIKAFRNISIQGTTSTDIVAAGVYEALLTTAEGLCVGIPLFLAYHYFRGRLNEFGNQFEEYSTRFVKALYYGSPAGGAASK